MKIERLLARFRWFFFREWALYILILTVAFMCVDVSGVVQSVKIRKLNDLFAGVNRHELFAFSKGEIPATAVNWKRLITYFRTVLKLFPSNEDAELFLGYCEYYGLGQEDKALEHFRNSADHMPSLFWNLYNTGIFLFKKGDMDDAVIYLWSALLAPPPGILSAMVNSIIYQQFFAEALNPGLQNRWYNARENGALLLAASFFYKHNYDVAELFAMKGVTYPDISNREPFYFYAGAIEMAKGNSNKALSFFDKAIKAKSTNPLVYHYAATILKKLGRLQEAQKISQMEQALGQGYRLDQFPYPTCLRLRLY